MHPAIDVYLEQVLSGGRVDLLDTICAQDFRFYSATLTEGMDLDAFKALIRQLHIAFPDLRAEAIDAIEGEGRTAVVFRYSGTQAEPFMGIPAMGNRFDLNAVDIFKIQDEQIVEIHVFMDRATMASQLTNE